ncbi:hypothetical protein AL480_15205 [Stenotrophomonas maltophilia]|uniref:hypothetical protein n=1 Tax=Stenotrophomonas maltophilia TaxID=40324 RepID=UPI0005399F8C|nr:hypothetical protein [Stenotrophomonas maltophilia]AVH92112.1 hypothetical protein AL480_15205 [Stenotrophomonas maltophilia]KOO72989.1 hypothetical protein VK66_10410 [Stenotrophomonas maltophilia]MBN5037250.1 hypothetical protein [Stenotrophomonas maltophilia]MBN5053837.1 hypothetical protein [Stenotrophomonas maltophilia]HEL5329124.1 hypothetical protein [Stenotrophomonas maltophilia]
MSELHIASGFFRGDMAERLEKETPDYSFTKASGRIIHLYGASNTSAVHQMVALSNSLKGSGLNATASVQRTQGENTPTWHAKMQVHVHQDAGPVIAVVGSSNMTMPAMLAHTETGPQRNISLAQQEADVVMWLAGNQCASEVVRIARSEWGSEVLGREAFVDSKYDDEVKKLIDGAYDSLLKFDWERVDE